MISNIYELVFPEELSGEEVAGVDVQMLALDAIRLVDYFTREAQLSEEQYEVLIEINNDLPKILDGLQGEHLNYFKKIQDAITEVVQNVKNT